MLDDWEQARALYYVGGTPWEDKDNVNKELQKLKINYKSSLAFITHSQEGDDPQTFVVKTTKNNRLYYTRYNFASDEVVTLERLQTPKSEPGSILLTKDQVAFLIKIKNATLLFSFDTITFKRTKIPIASKKNKFLNHKGKIIAYEDRKYHICNNQGYIYAVDAQSHIEYLHEKGEQPKNTAHTKVACTLLNPRHLVTIVHKREANNRLVLWQKGTHEGLYKPIDEIEEYNRSVVSSSFFVIGLCLLVNRSEKIRCYSLLSR